MVGARFVVLTDDGRGGSSRAAPLHVAEVRGGFSSTLLSPEQYATLGVISEPWSRRSRPDAPHVHRGRGSRTPNGCGNSDAEAGVGRLVTRQQSAGLAVREPNHARHTVDNPIACPASSPRLLDAAAPTGRRASCRPGTRSKRRLRGVAPVPVGASTRTSPTVLLLDHSCPWTTHPAAAVGAPWHPHRGSRPSPTSSTASWRTTTRTAARHHSSARRHPVMTAGSGSSTTRCPPSSLRSVAAPTAVQLWVTAAALKFHPPRYHAITQASSRCSRRATGALVRLIAGLARRPRGPPGSTHTPITYAHASISPGHSSRFRGTRTTAPSLYVLRGRVVRGAEARPVEAHDWWCSAPATRSR